jgi:hypothetical protein
MTNTKKAGLDHSVIRCRRGDSDEATSDYAELNDLPAGQRQSHLQRIFKNAPIIVAGLILIDLGLVDVFILDNPTLLLSKAPLLILLLSLYFRFWWPLSLFIFVVGFNIWLVIWDGFFFFYLFPQVILGAALGFSALVRRYWRPYFNPTIRRRP